MAGGHPVRGGAHQLGVGLNGELHDDRLAVPRRHLLGGLEDMPTLDLGLQVVFDALLAGSKLGHGDSFNMSAIGPERNGSAD